TVVATSCAVASANVERGTANMRLGMTLEIATSLGAIIGGLTVARMDPKVLEEMFAVVLLPTAFLMWHGKTENADAVVDEDQDNSTLTPALSQRERERSSGADSDLGLLGQR